MEGSVCRCLFCNANVDLRKEKSSTVSNNTLFGRGSKENGDILKSQVSTFFMLRKVLGLPQEFLESLLRSCGSPSEWKIKLCRCCERLFKEAELLWDRMCQLQRDYEKVTFEIKDTLINSMGPEEIQLLDENVEGETKKAALQELLKPSNVVEGVRIKFLFDLQDESDENTFPDKEVPVLTAASVTKNGNPSKQQRDARDRVIWSEKGVPYLSFADFEKRMKQLVEIANSVQTSKCVPVNSSSSKTPDIEEAANRKVGKDKKMTSRTSSFEESSPSVAEAHLSNEDTSKESKSNSVQTEPEGEEPVLRIVQTSTVTEEEMDEDNDSVPHVMGVIKVDLDEHTNDGFDPLTIDEATDDPLTIDDTNDDPDYTPTNSAKPATNKNSSEKAGKSKLSSLEIRPLRKKPNGFECSKCSAGFDSRLGCQIHILRDHYGETLPFHCNCCDVKFALYHQLRLHISTAHGSSDTPYDDDYDTDLDPKSPGRIICPVISCSKTFTRKAALSKHALSVHGTSLGQLMKTGVPARKKNEYEHPGLECNFCVKRGILYRAPTKDILELHYQKVHKGMIEAMKARIKPKIAQRSKFKPSERRKSATQKTPMKCPDCSTVLPDIESMAEHLKNPEHKCPNCPKHFLFEMELRNHLELDHLDRSFHCPYCAKTFTSLIVYEKHMDSHQSFDTHECDICHVKFTGLDTLKRHIVHAHQEEVNGQEQVQQGPEIFGL